MKSTKIVALITPTRTVYSYHLVEYHLDGVRDRLHERGPHLSSISYKLLTREDRTVHPQRADQQELIEGTDRYL